MEQAIQDFKYGFRMLLKSRSRSAAAVLALTLGIGANTAIFSVVNAVLLKPLPYPQPEQLVRIRETSSPFGFISIAYPNFLEKPETILYPQPSGGETDANSMARLQARSAVAAKPSGLLRGSHPLVSSRSRRLHIDL